MAPPKNKAGNKKSKDSGDDAGSSKKVKESQFVNVRHILVRVLRRQYLDTELLMRFSVKSSQRKKRRLPPSMQAANSMI